MVGHFTAVVWKNVKAIACATGKCEVSAVEMIESASSGAPDTLHRAEALTPPVATIPRRTSLVSSDTHHSLPLPLWLTTLIRSI